VRELRHRSGDQARPLPLEPLGRNAVEVRQRRHQCGVGLLGSLDRRGFFQAVGHHPVDLHQPQPGILRPTEEARAQIRQVNARIVQAAQGRPRARQDVQLRRLVAWRAGQGQQFPQHHDLVARHLAVARAPPMGIRLTLHDLIHQPLQPVGGEVRTGMQDFQIERLCPPRQPQVLQDASHQDPLLKLQLPFPLVELSPPHLHGLGVACARVCARVNARARKGAAPAHEGVA